MLSCPRCAGWASGGHGCLIWLGVVLLFQFGLILLLLRPTYRCSKCGFTFKA